MLPDARLGWSKQMKKFKSKVSTVADVGPTGRLTELCHRHRVRIYSPEPDDTVWPIDALVVRRYPPALGSDAIYMYMYRYIASSNEVNSDSSVAALN